MQQLEPNYGPLTTPPMLDDAIEPGLELELQHATAMAPVWKLLATLLGSTQPAPQSETDALALSRAIASDLRNTSFPIGAPGSLSTEL